MSDQSEIVRQSIQRTMLHAGIVSKTETKEVEIYDPIKWITTEFYVPELNGPITLEPYQEAVLKEAYRVDENGLFVYSTVVWSDIKKSAKSSIAASVCIERAMHTRHASVKIIANDLKQADSRVAQYARTAIDLNPRLRKLVREKIYKLIFFNKSVIEAIPIDPHGEAGGNDDFVCFSELWGAQGPKAIQMWTETTLSPTKFGRSQRWVETYAGYNGVSVQLEQLYDTGVVNGRILDLGIAGLEVYANDAARQLTLWNTQPRCIWQTPAYYAQESASLLPEEFDRVHRNKWGSTKSPFVAVEWWDHAKVDKLPALDRYKEVIVAIDAAVSDDCFGIVALSREEDYLTVRFARAWTPPTGGKIIYSNISDPNDMEYPEGILRFLAKEYNVIQYVYDSYQLHHLCTMLKEEGVGYFQTFSQNNPRAEADKQLYDLIKASRIRHDGDQTLRDHIRNADRTPEKDNKLRIVKRSEKLKIDLAVCLSMGSFQGLKLLAE